MNIPTVNKHGSKMYLLPLIQICQSVICLARLFVGVNILYSGQKKMSVPFVQLDGF